MNTTDAQMTVTEALLAQARLVGQSDDPAVKLEAAKFEISLTKQIARLKTKTIRSHAAPQQD